MNQSPSCFLTTSQVLVHIAIGCLLMLTHTPIACSGQLGEVSLAVGPNVHVSVDRRELPQAELFIAADPMNSQKLIACSMQSVPKPLPSGLQVVAYASQDAGRHWKMTLEVQDAADPTCTYGPNGIVYVACMTRHVKEEPLHLYRSTDGGITWSSSVALRGSNNGIDRDFMAVDTSKGAFRGAVYITGTGHMDSIGGERLHTQTFLRSRDLGITFEINKPFYLPPTDLAAQGNLVILPDGTLFRIFEEFPAGRPPRSNAVYPQHGMPNAKLMLASSIDGGDSFGAPTTISDVWFTNGLNSGEQISYLAADVSSRYFNGRLYAVWPDQRAGHSQILFAYSCDRGKTWANPQIINDDRAGIDNSHPIEHTMPAIAVNPDGIVGISWYDRRDFPDESGWSVRFRASLDGGETWIPSVRVSEESNNDGSDSRFPTQLHVQDASWVHSAQPAANISVGANWFAILGGDTAGLAASLDGAFHPAWIDNRTGVPQVWTTAVMVGGRAVKNGSENLSTLDDVTSRVSLDVDLASQFYDRQTNIVTVNVRLKNQSTEELQGPVVTRVVGLRSELGIPKVLNADNSQVGTGAVWDFSSLLPQGKLKEGTVSGVRSLRFQISDIRPFRQGVEFEHVYIDGGRGFRWGMLDMDLRVLATLHRAGTSGQAP